MARPAVRLRLGLLLLLTAPNRAEAQGAEDTKRAETLYAEGRAAMDAGRYVEACPKLAESQRLDPGGGTLLALGLCHEGEGKTATALTELREAASAAAAKGRKDREKFARERVAALMAKVSTLAIDVSPSAARVPGLRVTRDGAVVERSEWGVETPIDPGEHLVTLEAPGHARVSENVVMRAGAEHRNVALDLGAAIVVEGSSPVPAQPAAPPEAPVERTPNAGLLYGGTALGIAGLAVSSVFGVRARRAWLDAKSACPQNPCADRGGLARDQDAKSAALVSTVGFGVGVLGAGLAAYALLAASPAAPPSSVRVSPTFGPSSAGLVARGAW